MKNLIFILLLFSALSGHSTTRDTLTVQSPDGLLCVKVWMGAQLTYKVLCQDKVLTGNSVIDLIQLNGKALSKQNKITSFNIKSVNSEIIVPVPERRKRMKDTYHQLTIIFKQPYKVTFKIYNEGVAYRITTLFKDSIYIKDEVARFSFAHYPSVYFPLIHKKSNADIFHTSYEELYPLLVMSDIPDTTLGYSPLLVVPEEGPKIAITE